jgi:hypothetical protein
MAQWHLDELRAELARRGWRVRAELPGNDYNVSATWELRRHGDAKTLLVDFDGLDDMRTLPLDQSYGCSVRGGGLELYFRRRGSNDPPARERWRDELAAFVKALS